METLTENQKFLMIECLKNEMVTAVACAKLAKNWSEKSESADEVKRFIEMENRYMKKAFEIEKIIDRL